MLMSVRFRLPPRHSLQPNNERDPLRYYYRPLTAWIYQHRLQMGLDLLPPDGQRALEVGVGSGILIPTLTAAFPEYLGTDLVLAAGLDALVAPGCRARFQSANLLTPDSLPEGRFDVIVCFSVLEHIADTQAAASALARALAPGGTLIAGYPMVNPAMSHAFAAIGYPNIDDDHVATPARIDKALREVLRAVARTAFPPYASTSLALYQCTSWTRV